jgi:hypothetical protein
MSLKQETKAKEIVEKITKVDENTYILPSTSDIAKTHTVTYRDGIEVTGDYECDCLGYQYSENCYHILAVKMLKQKEESK